MNRTKTVTIVFFVIAMLDLIGVAFDIAMLKFIFKPLIIISLMVLYYLTASKINKWYIVALVFSFLGDVLLMDKLNLFLFGIGSFLVTQIIYIFIIVGQMKKPTNFHKYLYAFLFVNYVVFFLNLLRPNLGELFYPVLIYGITISVFGLVSTLNYVTKRTKTSLLLMLGALLFIASDSMIALNKFYQPNIYYPVSTMVTYILAQFLIYRFMISPTSDMKLKS